jgi:hypothetical protein
MMQLVKRETNLCRPHALNPATGIRSTQLLAGGSDSPTTVVLSLYSLPISHCSDIFTSLKQ